MLFPAAKMMDFMIGVDMHSGLGVPIHPFFGPIFVWTTPKFPQMNVFINNMPACAVGSTGYLVHIPTLITPAKPLNLGWFLRKLLNIPLVLMTVAMTTLVNSIIALAAAELAPKSPATQAFVLNVTETDIATTDNESQGVLDSFKRFTGEGWPMTWIQLLMPSLPYPASNGSTAFANPTVHVNGAPLALGVPLASASCSDIPAVPNAFTLAISNVFVSMSLSQFLLGAGAHAVSGLISAGVGKGMSKAGKGIKKGMSRSKGKSATASPKNNKSQAKKGCNCT